MRITGGLYKGRTVACPPGVIRPAMDRMRVSLFSILGSLEGLSFLDCFSGSGLVGIEAASRGAAPVDLVEKDYGKKATILRNLAWVESPIRLHLMPAERYLARTAEVYDIIYLDPPFPLGQKLDFLVLAGQRLKPGGSLLMHYPGEETYPETLDGGLRRYDFRTYGRSHVLFYTKDEAQAPLTSPAPDSTL